MVCENSHGIITLDVYFLGGRLLKHTFIGLVMEFFVGRNKIDIFCSFSTIVTHVISNNEQGHLNVLECFLKVS